MKAAAVMRKYTAAQRAEILQRAHSTLARLRLAECVEGLREERNWAPCRPDSTAAREGDRLLLAIDRQHQGYPARSNRAGLIYKTKWDAKIV